MTASAGAVEDADALETELALARSPRLYLVLDLSSCRLLIKSRSLELDSIAPVACAQLAVRPLLGRGEWPQLELPAVWRVEEAPDGSWRRVVAPPTLRPYSEDEEVPTPAAGGAPAATPGPIELPTDYTVSMDSGWLLEVTASAPGWGWRRFAGAAASGWRRVWGFPQSERPPRLVLEMSSEDAQRALHLFQQGLAILVVGEEDPPPE